jgi:hypothetical protein
MHLSNLLIVCHVVFEKMNEIEPSLVAKEPKKSLVKTSQCSYFAKHGQLLNQVKTIRFLRKYLNHLNCSKKWMSGIIHFN